jgi:glutathione-regulated potassium-efflux system ancillary protein KefG
MTPNDPVKLPKANTKKILILFAHPAIHKSRANRELIKPIRKLKDITFHDLYEHYPDFYINVPREQRLLKKHDIIVLMHPFYWYSAPAILKEWQDLVLEHGFAYGEGGTALRNKLLFPVITTSGSAAAYQTTGRHRYTIEQFLKPIEQTAYLCGMKYLPPFVTHSALKLTLEEIIHQAARLKNTLINLRDKTDI